MTRYYGKQRWPHYRLPNALSVPARRVARSFNPLRSPPWEGFLLGINWPSDRNKSSKLFHKLVRQFVARNILCSEQIGYGDHLLPTRCGLSWPDDYTEDQKSADLDYVQAMHIARVAYLLVNPSWWPVGIEVGDHDFYVSDGNHRLAAAIIAKRNVNLTYGGSVAGFFRQFGDCQPVNIYYCCATDRWVKLGRNHDAIAVGIRKNDDYYRRVRKQRNREEREWRERREQKNEAPPPTSQADCKLST